MSENFQNQTFVQNENKGKKNDADYVENVHITVLCSCCILRDDQEMIMTSLLTYLIFSFFWLDCFENWNKHLCLTEVTHANQFDTRFFFTSI